MTIIITGGNGLLGSTLYKDFSKQDVNVQLLDRSHIISLNKELLEKYLSDLGTSILIHCAANTNVEACEDDRFACYRDNVILTEKLAIACKIEKIKFVFISSTGVYGNYQTSPYCEYDEVIPTTVHHRSKFIAEKRLIEILNSVLIIRTGWLFGGSWDMPKNFVANRIKEALKSDGQIQSDTSQKGNPTFVGDLSAKIIELIDNNQTGIFNCVNQGIASRFEYVSEIINLSGLSTNVLPVDGSNFNRRAQVSYNESAINFKLVEFGFDDMPHWKQSLKKYIRTIRYEYDIE